MGLRVAVKEWAGVIAALAQGRQILLIRKYLPKHSSFLLYPTYTYYRDSEGHPERLNAKIQELYRTSAREAAIEELREPDLVNLRYLFELDGVVEWNSNDFDKLVPYMIWTVDHVAAYAETAKNGMYIWFGRTSKLVQPVLVAREVTGSPALYTHFKDFDIGSTQLVLPEGTYLSVRERIIGLGKLITPTGRSDTK